MLGILDDDRSLFALWKVFFFFFFFFKDQEMFVIRSSTCSVDGKDKWLIM